jgi:lipopolysaccharide transport system ATP-binding protein
LSDFAIRCRGIGKRFSREQIVPYQGLRTKIHQAIHRRRRAAPAEHIWALRDVELEVRPGAVVAVLGNNGSGKSVLLKILARVTKPTTGRSEVQGAVGSILHLGAMLNPELTGRENLYQTGALLRVGRAAIDRRFDQIVDFAGVEEQLDSVVRGYSAGMQLRLAFAVVAHLESDVLLIDEALSVGDEQFRGRCADRIRRLAAEGRTVVIVSHELEMLAGMCDWAILLSQGRLLASGRFAAVADEYRDHLLPSAV